MADAENKNNVSSDSSGEVVPMATIEDTNTQLSQSMKSNTEVVRIDDSSMMGGGTQNTSMVSIGMAGATGTGAAMDEESNSDEDSDQAVHKGAAGTAAKAG